MKIRDVVTYALRAPLDRPFYFSQPGWVRAMTIEQAIEYALTPED